MAEHDGTAGPESQASTSGLAESMTDEQILEVFKVLRLPTNQPALPAVHETFPVVFYPITGDSPPLPTR